MTDPIITLAPNQVSTWKPDNKDNQIFDAYFDFTAGEIWGDPADVPGYDYVDGIASLDMKDLACPTWGLGRSTAANGTVITTIGPPWLPLIIPPMEVFTLNPVWSARCTGIFSDQLGLHTLALFDPPIALTPANGLLPTPRPTLTPASTPAGSTTVPEGATPSTEAAKPVSFPDDPAVPEKTGDPARDGPTKSHSIASAKPTSLLDNSATPPNDKGDPPSDPKVSSVHAISGDPPADSNAPSSRTPDPPLDGSQKSIIDPKVSIVPGSPQGERLPTQTKGLGAIIYNAFGKSGPEIDASSTILFPPQSVFTIGSQIFTANPSAFSLAGTTVSVNGPPVTISGTIISLGQNGALQIGSSTISLPTDPPSKVYTVAGQTFVPNPSAFPIDGTIISAGGPAATVHGTIISLGASGALQIGSSTIPLLPSPASPNTTMDGFDINAQPSFIVVDGVTLSPAAPGVTISGEQVSLEAGGKTVDIGTGRFAVPTPTTTGDGVDAQAFTGGQGRGVEVSLSLVCGIVVGVVVMVVL